MCSKYRFKLFKLHAISSYFYLVILTANEFYLPILRPLSQIARPEHSPCRVKGAANKFFIGKTIEIKVSPGDVAFDANLSCLSQRQHLQVLVQDMYPAICYFLSYGNRVPELADFLITGAYGCLGRAIGIVDRHISVEFVYLLRV